jgi:fatty acid desaturase
MKKKKKKKKKVEGRKADLQWLTMLLVAVEGKNSGGSRQGTVAAAALLFLPFAPPLVFFLSFLFLLCYLFFNSLLSMFLYSLLSVSSFFSFCFLFTSKTP